MKKTVLILLLAVLLLTSCNTYTGAGAATGGYFGAMVGSMIGGISDGRRGSNVGGLIGMAGGAVLGAVVGNAADQEEARRREEYYRDREERMARRQVRARTDDSDDRYDPDDSDYFDPTNSGDDRITFDDDATTPAPPAATITPATHEGLILRNAQFIDANNDGVLIAGEECRVSFEIMNYSDKPVYDVQPLVYDLTGNKHIHISQNLHVERILPHRGIRYTATIKGDSRLKNGTAHIRLSVAQGNREVDGQAQDFVVTTRKK